jgi:predicted TIM-barrel fold metal-dependent hydrolase
VRGSLPDGIVDPHIHQWDPLTSERIISREARLLRRVKRVPPWVTRLQSRAKREFVGGDPNYVLKPYLPKHYRADAGTVAVSSIVHIETSSIVMREHLDAVEETRWVAALPWDTAGAPSVGGIVVHVDPRWADAAAVLDAHLAASDRVRGVRLSAAHHPDPGVMSFAHEPHLLREPDFLRGFGAVAERGLSFEIWIYAHQLPDALVLANEYPDATFVLDHYATPVGIFGPRGRSAGHAQRDRADILARWRDEVAALGALPNVVAKHSGLGMPVLGGVPKRPVTSASRAELVERCAPLIRHLHEVFGNERTMWASNFPIDKPVHSIPASLEIVLGVLGDDAQPDLLTRDVARRVYRL